MLQSELNNIGVVILAAGQGRRMGSELPKVMHTLNEKPLIEHVVERVKSSGVCDNLVVVVSKDHTLIQDHVGDRARYAIQEKQLGTGHATAAACEAIGNVDHVVVLYGDMPFIEPESIRRLVETHRGENSVLTVLTATTPDFTDWKSAFETFGRVVRNDEGNVQKIVEWKDADEDILKIKELSTCFFCFDAAWLWDRLAQLDNTNAQEEYYLTDLVTFAIGEGHRIHTAPVALHEAMGVNRKEDLEILGKIINPKS